MGVCILKIGGPCHVDAIAVVLALEHYQNSIAKNLRVRDVTVDIYVWLWFPPPPPPGRDLFSHQTGGEIVFHQAKQGGGGIYLFTRQGETS